MKKNTVTEKLVAILFFFILCFNVSASEKVIIEGVPIINQHPELPTGCEVTALTMIMQYHDVNVTKEQLAKEVTKVPVPYSSNGKLYGGDPNKGFIGDPFSKRGFGVYKDALIPMIEKYLPGRAEDLSGGDFSQVYKALDEGKPVMIWSTIAMLNVDSKKSYWTTLEGETIEWKTPEHAVVVVGYDDEYIYINDPYVGKQRKYKKQVVINRWSDMGKQALTITPSHALQKTEVIKKQSAIIDGVKYVDLLTLDNQGLWAQARMLPNLFSKTTVTYDPSNYSVLIRVTGNEAVPNLENIVMDPAINYAIPKNELGKYALDILLKPLKNDLVTYNKSGERVDMVYKIIDGITYVNKEWIEKFYNTTIEVID